MHPFVRLAHARLSVRGDELSGIALVAEGAIVHCEVITNERIRCRMSECKSSRVTWKSGTSPSLAPSLLGKRAGKQVGVPRCTLPYILNHNLPLPLNLERQHKLCLRPYKAQSRAEELPELGTGSFRGYRTSSSLTGKPTILKCTCKAHLDCDSQNIQHPTPHVARPSITKAPTLPSPKSSHPAPAS